MRIEAEHVPVSISSDHFYLVCIGEDSAAVGAAHTAGGRLGTLTVTSSLLSYAAWPCSRVTCGEGEAVASPASPFLVFSEHRG